jgi:hypothetical protein
VTVAPRMLRIDETSELTTLPVSTLRYLRHLGEGPPAFRLGRASCTTRPTYWPGLPSGKRLIPLQGSVPGEPREATRAGPGKPALT